MHPIGKKMILASGSPRRKDLLEKMGFEFEILITDANEDIDEGIPPSEVVSVLSKRKADEAVKICDTNNRNDRIIIIAADTIVYKDGKILGKPKDKEDAFNMLKILEDDWHGVYTGLTVAFMNGFQGPSVEMVEYVQKVCHTRVHFKPLSDERIKEYVNTGEPFDKAGAYAIQGMGGLLVDRIEGDYNNVVGLPTDMLKDILR